MNKNAITLTLSRRKYIAQLQRGRPLSVVYYALGSVRRALCRRPLAPYTRCGRTHTNTYIPATCQIQTYIRYMYVTGDQNQK